MHTVVLILITVVLLVDQLVGAKLLPGVFKFLQEAIGVVVAAYVVFVGVRTQFRNVNPAYWLVFSAFAICVVCGIVANSEDAGPLFAGLRTYFRALPLFFLPAVLMIGESQLRRQLLLILAIALVQFPIALLQRLKVLAENRTSGDTVVGTLTNSAFLSVFCICVACVLVALFLRKRLRPLPFVALLLLVLAPTTLNETKATIFLLPLGLLIVFLGGSQRGTRFRNSVLAVCLLALFGSIFVPVYDYFIKPRWGYGIVEFMTMQGRLEGYLAKDTELGSNKEAGRIDAVVVPFKGIAQDPTHLAFGFGIGNASLSSLGEQFTGEYFRRYESFILSSVSVLLLETGVLGLFLAMSVFWLIYRDSRVVAARDKGLVGTLALAWTGCTAVMAATMFYKVTLASGALSYLYWYFSGIVAAQRMRIALAATRPATVRSTAAAA